MGTGKRYETHEKNVCMYIILEDFFKLLKITVELP